MIDLGLSLCAELAESANTVIAFYTMSLGAAVGPLYRPPDLAFLARLWFSPSSAYTLSKSRDTGLR